MPPTADQVLALAPDASSASAGRKLSSPRDWKNLGYNDTALWGDCQGSALYGVSVDLSDLTCRCTCPSRKFPCKHGLGLMLQHAAGTVPRVETAPERTTTWLAGRTERAAKKADATPATAEQVAKKAAKAEAKLADLPLGPFALWLEDLARAGLATLERDGGKQLQREAARLVDASAPGLAARCRELAEQVGSGPGWAEVVLAGLGELRLLVSAVERSDQLSDALRADLRAAVGVPVTQDEVRLNGPREAGRWLVGGAVVHTDTVGLKVRRTWLLRADDPGVHALILDFAPGAMPLPMGLPPGAVFEATLARWPGASGQRALIAERGGEGGDRPTGLTIAAALEAATEAFARLPWLRTVPLLLADVAVVLDGDAAWLRDAGGDGLRLPELPVDLLAVAGGEPSCVCVEWNGAVAVPMAAWPQGELLVPTLLAARPSAPVLAELARVALVGGDGDLPATPVDAALPEGPRARRLLWAAGALDAWGRAGTRPGRPPEPDACPVETLPEAPAGVLELLALVADKPTRPIVADLYTRLGAAGMRLPHRALPAALRATHHRSLIRPLLGERGQWMARLGGDWAWAIGAERPVDIETLPTPAARRDALVALRAKDPFAAREVLARLLPTEKADRRAELLGDLEPVATADDLPLVHGLAGDRSAAVVAIVDQIRVRLGDDPHAAVVRRRLDALITLRRGVLSAVGLAKPALVVRLPEATDPTWEADGLPKLPSSPGKPTTGMDRLRWLLGRVPPSELSSRLGLEPADFLTAFPKDLHDALTPVVDAAMRLRDGPWCEALLAHGKLDAATRYRLALALPPDLAEAQAIRELDSLTYELSVRLSQLDRPWGPALINAVIRRIQTAGDSEAAVVSNRLSAPLVAGLPDADLPRVAAMERLWGDGREDLEARQRLAALLPEAVQR